MVASKAAIHRRTLGRCPKVQLWVRPVDLNSGQLIFCSQVSALGRSILRTVR